MKKPDIRPHYALAIIAVAAIDQLTKYLVRRNIAYGRAVDITPFLQIVHANNTGIAFGMLHGMNLVLIFVALAIIIMLVSLSGEITAYAGKLSRAGVLLILCGAVGNLVDRILFGRITDFIYFGIKSWRFPAFNVADSCITVGGILLAVLLALGGEKKAPPRETPPGRTDGKDIQGA